jgi:hypothetical protein
MDSRFFYCKREYTYHMKTEKEIQDSITIEHITPRIMCMRFMELSMDPIVSTAQAVELEERILELNGNNPGIVLHFLVDGSRVSNSQFISPAARRIYKRLYSLPQAGNIAFVGLGRWLKLLTVIFSQVVRRRYRTQWFTTEAEALAWLKELHT